jgi:uncharacterized protein (DUF952 family)
MNIFHIVSVDAWNMAVAEGSYRPESLRTEGFIHFSYAGQVAATANRYYRELNRLQVLEADPTLLAADLRNEPSPVSGELFPHFYGPLPVDSVVAMHPLERDETGAYVFDHQ